jgi:uncharacterized protein YprB with RNaseH-like and TPR domain
MDLLRYNVFPMSSLSDKLKKIGVQVGAEKVPKPGGQKFPIERVVEGELRATPLGEVFLAEQLFPLTHQHGTFELNFSSPMTLVAAWARDERIANMQPEQFAFIDTETTGLAGGSGTYAFLVGAGRFEADGFRLGQFFMRDPADEPALLAALEAFLAPCDALVTFNGKAFDLPLLQARYITNSAPFPWKDSAHLDLLHLARRLWRQRLPSRTLGYLEEHVIGQARTGEDVPGWLIPDLYFDYLRSGDARPLKGVFYHNAMDILSLAVLTEYTAHLLADPLDGRVEHALDLVAIGKLNEDLGYLDQAALILERGLEQDLPPEVRQQTVKRLSFIHKRRGEMPLALSLWWQAAADRQIYAHEELAKHYEHTEKDFQEALRWTEAALAILALPDALFADKLQWEGELKHRRTRLREKLARQTKTEAEESKGE